MVYIVAFLAIILIAIPFLLLIATVNLIRATVTFIYYALFASNEKVNKKYFDANLKNDPEYKQFEKELEDILNQ